MVLIPLNGFEGKPGHYTYLSPSYRTHRARSRDKPHTNLIIKINQLHQRWTSVTLKLKIGKKGYIILPKSIRESVGLEEGDTVTVEIGDGITLTPERKPDLTKLRKAINEHIKRLKTLKNTTSPTPGELASTSLEEEFEE